MDRQRSADQTEDNTSMDPSIQIAAAALVVAKTETGKVLTQGAVDGAGALLSRLCLPAAEELGLIAKDFLHGVRRVNLAKIEAKAKAKVEALERSAAAPLKAPLSLLIEVMDSGSKVSDDTLQDMWAGLLAASCSSGGEDDSNLQFVHMVSSLSPQQARLFRWISEHCPTVKDKTGAVQGAHFRPEHQELMTAASIHEPHTLAASIAGLASLGLFHAAPIGGLGPCLGLSSLGVFLSLRVRGIQTDPLTHFGQLTVVDLDEDHTPRATWG